VKQWLLALERPRSITVLRWAIAIVLVAGLLTFIVLGANNPADPSFAPASSSLSHPLGMM
jgi:hypothetical protein